MSSVSSVQKDFFVSYARKDNENGWIKSFVEELKVEHSKFTAGRELTCFFDKDEIYAGADWQHKLTEGISNSKLFVAFISPNYFASIECRKEWRAWIDNEIGKHILTAGMRPVYIVEVPGLTDGKICEDELSAQLASFLKLAETDSASFLRETPGVVKYLRRRQLTHNQPFNDVQTFYSEGVAALRRNDLREVLDRLSKDLELHSELIAKADASITTIPPYNRNFSGRLDELLHMRNLLLKDDRTGVVYGVHGLGGIGKTELALTYAHAFASAYPGGRFLISCDGKKTLRDAILTQSDFTSLFADHISDEQRKNPDEYFAAILRQLGHRLNSLGHVLLLLDNVTDTGLLNREQSDPVAALGSNLHLLATTRLPAPPANSRNWISLDRLPDEAALELLEKHRPFTGDEDRIAAEEIVRQLGGFPIAVELVAAYLAVHESSSYSRVSSNIGLAGLEEMAGDDGVELRRHNHERRLSAVLEPVLASLTPAERRFMEYIAMLPPDQVPLPWLKQLVTQEFPDLTVEGGLKDPWAEIWLKLEKYSLIRRAIEGEKEPRLFRIHRLVQELVIRETSSDFAKHLQDGLYNLISERLTLLKNVVQWKEMSWELEPLIALAKLWPDDVVYVAPLLAILGSFLSDLAQWAEAESLLSRALAISEKTQGVEHPDVAKILCILVGVLHQTNKLDEAAPLLQRALAIEDKCRGSNSAEVASALVRIARISIDTNRLDEATILVKRALDIFESSIGLNHQDAATAINCLAQICFSKNRKNEAEMYFKKSLKIYEDCFGSCHREVATGLNNLATFYLVSNKYAEAEPLYKRSLAISVKIFGIKHPDVATGLNNLASLYINIKRFKPAERFLLRALEINEQSFGNEHPYVASTLNSLGSLYYYTKRFTEAEQMLRQALCLYEKVSSSNIESCQKTLAAVLVEVNKTPEANNIIKQLNLQGEDLHTKHLPKVGRNDPCPCNSGKKFKKCCGA